ncbi:MAG: TetR/AcrR family transcriptional regulator [Chloroflexota bacterium]
MNVNKNDKQKQILEAAIDLFAKEGFWNTPTTRIAKHAGVGNGTLFNYFESKDVLINAVYTQLKQEYISYIMLNYPEDVSVKARFEHIWFRYIDWGVRNPTRHELLIQLRLSDLVNKEAHHQDAEQIAAMLELVNQAVKADLLADMPIMYLGQVFEAQLDTAVRFAITNNLSDMERTRHITDSFAVLWKGITK